VARLGSGAETCFLWCFGGVWCVAVVVGADVAGGVPCFVPEEPLSCHAATAATIATIEPMATSGRRSPTPPRRGPDRANRLRNEERLVGVCEAVVVLVDVEVAVEAQVVGVGTQEPLDVGVTGQKLPALLFERLEVAVANPDRLLDLGGRETAFQAGLTQAPTDLEHAALSRMPRATANPIGRTRTTSRLDWAGTKGP